ncbi:conjugative transfer signal peptidase TraF [Ruegeria sp.]|uniref:conjugative transfer signal peptidase TraF n=1 Tax=Ruegeria sp. TaxID=1879320 RepID=UPI003AFF65C5
MKKAVLLPLAAVLSGVALIGISAIAHTPLLVWNASASAPIGLYRVTSGAPERGDLVLVQPSKSIAKLAAERRYLPAGVPLIKRIAAMSGDDVCAFNSVIIINGDVVADHLKVDRKGRPMPRWNECRTLEADEIFLLLTPAGSFDSRYFGPVKRHRIIARLAPLWTE